MNYLGRIFAAAATLASVVLTSVVLTATATPVALAVPLPPTDNGGGIAPPPPPLQVEGGMPGWQIALIAMAAALVAAAVAVLLDRARTARMSHAPTA